MNESFLLIGAIVVLISLLGFIIWYFRVPGAGKGRENIIENRVINTSDTKIGQKIPPDIWNA